MVAIEEIEQRLLTLPLKQRVFLAESLLASVPLAKEEMTQAPCHRNGGSQSESIPPC